MLYDAIAGSNGFYNSPVDPGARWDSWQAGHWSMPCGINGSVHAAALRCAAAVGNVLKHGCPRVAPRKALMHLGPSGAPLCRCASLFLILTPSPPRTALCAAVRSLMNVPFTIPSNPDLEKEFIAQAAKLGMVSGCSGWGHHGWHGFKVGNWQWGYACRQVPHDGAFLTEQHTAHAAKFTYC